MSVLRANEAPKLMRSVFAEAVNAHLRKQAPFTMVQWQEQLKKFEAAATTSLSSKTNWNWRRLFSWMS